VITLTSAMRRCITLLFVAGCGFSSPAGAPDAQITPVIDAAVDTSMPSGPDAAMCVAGVVDICGMPAPAMPFDVTAPTPLDTGRDPRCKTVMVAGHDVCLIYATEVTITATLTVTGNRPLALVSASTMMVTGAIDAGSHGPQVGPAADDACAFASNPQNDRGGAGGGAGGGLTLAGGDGGTGNTNKNMTGSTGAGGTHGATVPTPALRGGCRGQKGGDEQPGGFSGGAGGHGGGALYLAARQSVTVSGSIGATGAGGAGGGSQSGGGGGGSGGMVVIESASITVSGQISANGGGGGQGGGRLLNGDNVTGFAGADGSLGMTQAPGGFGAANGNSQFSTGGVGGAGTTAAGRGTDSTVGGGGGGGAAGVVRLIGTINPAGSIISPPPS
jgi:hypothetical protein